LPANCSRAIPFRPSACSAIPTSRLRGKQDPGELFPGASWLWRHRPLAAAAQGAAEVSFETGLRAFGYGLRPDMDVQTATVMKHSSAITALRASMAIADKDCEAILAALLHEIDFQG